jgi:hypothetical protein
VFKITRSRIAGLVLLIVVAVLGLSLAIQRSSPAAPDSLRTKVEGVYEGNSGFWLHGNLVNTPITDWSFTDAIPTIQVETRTWYFLPHFVRTYIARDGTQLYLFSEYFAPKPGQPDYRDDFPNARFWNRMVVRDPRIRVKIGNRLFRMRAYPLTDSREVALARQAFLSKYDDVKQMQELPKSQRPRLHFFRLEQGWNDNP